MSVFVLTMVTALLISGALFFLLGARFAFSPDEVANEGRNFAAYFVGSLPIAFVLIFFGLG